MVKLWWWWQVTNMAGETMEHPWLSLIETICIAWFTLEYFLRLHRHWQQELCSFDNIHAPLTGLREPHRSVPSWLTPSTLWMCSPSSHSLSPSSLTLALVLSSGAQTRWWWQTPPAPASPRRRRRGRGLALWRTSCRYSGSSNLPGQKLRSYNLSKSTTLRVLKLARHSPGLQAIAYTLKHSYKVSWLW